MNTEKIREEIKVEFKDTLMENTKRLRLFIEEVEKVKDKITWTANGYKLGKGQPLTFRWSEGLLYVNDQSNTKPGLYIAEQIFEIRFDEDFASDIINLESDQIEVINSELNWIKEKLGYEDIANIDIGGYSWNDEEEILYIAFFITEDCAEEPEPEKVIIDKGELEGLINQLENMEYAIQDIKNNINSMY